MTYLTYQEIISYLTILEQKNEFNIQFKILKASIWKIIASKWKKIKLKQKKLQIQLNKIQFKQAIENFEKILTDQNSTEQQAIQTVTSIFSFLKKFKTQQQKQQLKIFKKQNKLQLSMQTVLGNQREQEKNKILEQLLADEKIDNNLKKQAQSELNGLEQIQKDENLQKSFIFSKRCYICRKIYYEMHFYYFSLCKACGDFNYMKRTEKKVNLTGKIAIVTGGRIKIGFYICLILLRNGCQVHATSRFVKDAIQRYKKEPDYEQFKNRLFLYSLDFRNIQAVYQFCNFINQNLPKIDILINNAAQTVRRDNSYYKQLIEIEGKPLKEFQEDELQILSYDIKFQNMFIITNNNTSSALEIQNQMTQYKEQQQIENISNQSIQNFTGSALMTLQPLLNNQKNEQINIYPDNILNQYQQQLDLSIKNSWVYRLEDVPIMEFMETQVINSWAPFIMCQQLKDSMIKTPQQLTEKKFIVNVSSVEGQFNRNYKSITHPHNNMSKAALNMLTRTSGLDYFKKYNIFMSAVDTGWASNDMLPLYFLHQKYNDTVPIDEWDGAFRVLDPVFEGYNGKQSYYGVFMQHYKVADW